MKNNKVLVVAVILLTLILVYPILNSRDESSVNTLDLGQQNEIPQNVNEQIDQKSNVIVVNEPRPLEEISSPLRVSGEARGIWYFEANFPVRLVDEQGNLIAQHYATAKGEWMTEDFVPFEAEIVFEDQNGGTGYLILEKSNPSDLEENSDELRIPVMFAEPNID